MPGFKNLKTLSLGEWFVFGMGKFVMGFGLGVGLAGSLYGLWIFLAGVVLEIPSLVAVARHQREE